MLYPVEACTFAPDFDSIGERDWYGIDPREIPYYININRNWYKHSN